MAGSAPVTSAIFAGSAAASSAAVGIAPARPAQAMTPTHPNIAARWITRMGGTYRRGGRGSTDF